MHGTYLTFLPSNNHTKRGHPENADRMMAIMRLLERSNVLPDLIGVEPVPASTEQLSAVHSASLINFVRDRCEFGGGHLDADTYITGDSYRLAKLAAGATCVVADQVMGKEGANGLALVRPPGHHAERGRVGGFCLFNNVAVAARHAQNAHGARRVVIIDYDVHHGNGTQQIFYSDPTVMYVSLHLYASFFYPGTGGANELGEGPGRGKTLNVPFMPGAGDDGYLQVFKHLIRPKIIDFMPDLIIVSAGFDAHWIDPLAAASMTLPGYVQLDHEIIQLANDSCQGRVMFVLEGGYNLRALSYGILNLCYSLQQRDKIIDPLGPASDTEPDVTSLLKKLQSLHLPV